MIKAYLSRRHRCGPAGADRGRRRARAVCAGGTAAGRGTLLADPVRAVRIAAARQLAAVPTRPLTPQQQADLDQRAGGVRRCPDGVGGPTGGACDARLLLCRSRPGGRRRSRLSDRASARSRLSCRPWSIWPISTAPMQRDADGEPLLRQAVADRTDNAVPRHALGLLLLRTQRLTRRCPELRQAAQLAPSNARYAYVYAIALHTAGQSPEALRVLRSTHEMHPADVDVLIALDHDLARYRRSGGGKGLRRAAPARRARQSAGARPVPIARSGAVKRWAAAPSRRGDLRAPGTHAGHCLSLRSYQPSLALTHHPLRVIPAKTGIQGNSSVACPGPPLSRGWHARGGNDASENPRSLALSLALASRCWIALCSGSAPCRLSPT